jgi:hypothetical protein
VSVGLGCLTSGTLRTYATRRTPVGFAFDDDTFVQPLGGGRYAGRVNDRWNVGDKPNGGYLLALALQAAARELPHQDPVTATAHYLRAARVGDVEIAVEVVRAGRSVSTAMIAMSQAGREVVRSLATFGLLASSSDPVRYLASPPRLPEQGIPARADLPGRMHVELVNRFEYAMDPATVGWAFGQPTGEARMAGRLRFADGRDVDSLALAVVVDAFPPAVFNLGAAGWTPTVELTLHVRQRPVAGWLQMSVATRFVSGRYLEEDVEVWDAADRLVAQGRQLALLSSPLPQDPVASTS